MTQDERRVYLLKSLLREKEEYEKLTIPESVLGQKRLLRALFNVRAPAPVSQEFLDVQDAYLKEATAEKGVTDYHTLTPVRKGIWIWQGDITTLACGAIVNAANSQMLGCFNPGHGCIDNIIHTYAGVELRLRMNDIMREQGHEEPVGRAKITPAYNLPCRYVLHTVGPCLESLPTKQDEELLADCYRSCLSLAAENGVDSVAFCCISTGVFHCLNRQAAESAIREVMNYRKGEKKPMDIIFNVFKDMDYAIYQELLG